MSLPKLLVLILISQAALVQGAVIYQFSVTGVNRATGFADSSGTPANGMRWGLVFDTTGNGFNGFTANGTAPVSSTNGQYDFMADQAVSGFLNFNGVGTDDYYWVPTPGTNLTSPLGAVGVDPGGAGGILTAQGAPVGTDTLPLGLNSLDKFAIIWFNPIPTVGSSYGLFTDSTFQLPSSGAGPFPFNAPFTGGVADSAKAANLTFGPAPEPSRAILGCLGMLCVMMRRRRV